MTGNADALSQLVSLLEEARLQAARLGPAAGIAVQHIEAALTDLHASEARGGKPDEGVRLDDLTTDNDK